ncbi:SDR family oxidoreductase [Myroides marinus]|uniref:SDR family oxidoreductase n=1 Tax=Myroides marinus TaxID=703342 RepID=UPI0025785294|nr:SDR family oxidoreductase [Myroides marinus]MDM1501249.1 SDR family oxidoreductase [Myroides marinus]
MSNTKVWYITGASKGMGLSLVKQLLDKGYRVAATSRTIGAFNIVEKHKKNFLALEVDLKDEQSIACSIKKAVEVFGSIDVVVNNAGYGLGGSIEELTTLEIQENFQVNFFSIVSVIKQVLPFMREKHSGYIINISSIAGFSPGIGWSMYSATKAAVSGLSQALSNDLKPLGIKVTNVIPGWFRTNFAKKDSIVYSKESIADYSYLNEAYNKMSILDGMQLGDPDKIADVFIELVNGNDPITDLFLGSDAFNRAKQRIEHLSKEMDRNKKWSYYTDFE